MKNLFFLSILIVFKTLFAGEAENEIILEQNLAKLNLIESSFQSTDSLLSEEVDVLVDNFNISSGSYTK